MNATERLSGAESAGRIARYLENPCGFGTCAGHVDCRDKQCPEHPCKTGLLGLPVLDTMTDDRFNLHRVDTSRMPKGAVVDGGHCRADLPIQFAEEETTGLLNNIKRDAGFWLKWGACAVGGGLLIALVFHASTK